MEHAEKQREERLLHLEKKRKANEKEERKRREKKRKHLSQKQREAYNKKRAKKAAKRSKNATASKTTHQEEIVLLGPTWFPPGTPLQIDSAFWRCTELKSSFIFGIRILFFKSRHDYSY